MNRITKQQALELLPSVVDDEASPDEKKAFFDYISKDKDLKFQYESAQRLKILLTEKYRRTAAPARLKRKIEHILTEENLKEINRRIKSAGSRENQTEKKVADMQQARKPGLLFHYLSAAAVILLLSFVTIELPDRTNPEDAFEISIIEEYTAQHFLNSGGSVPESHFASHSTSEAEAYLEEHHGIHITVPELKSAEFAGILIADFYDGLQTPLLEYVQYDQDETIYIFAFDVEQIVTHKHLKRHDKAVENCITEQDFYVAEIGGHHVVSWMWHGNWYTAVSNHNGYDLASLIEPLNYNP